MTRGHANFCPNLPHYYSVQNNNQNNNQNKTKQKVIEEIRADLHSFIADHHDGCGTRSASLWVHRNLFWQLSRYGNLHGLGISHATTVWPKRSLRAAWKVGDAMVCHGWTASKSGHPCPCQNCSQGLLQKRLEEDLCWIIHHVPLMTQSVTGMNWTELNSRPLFKEGEV